MSTRYRAKISKKNKYWISKHRYYEIVHHCMQYKEWKDEYKVLSEQTISGVNYDGMPHGASVGNPVQNQGMRMVMLRDKMELIEKTAYEADPILGKYILLAATNEGVSFNYLKMVLDIPCEKDMYYDRRRKFYWLMSQRM